MLFFSVLSLQWVMITILHLGAGMHSFVIGLVIYVLCICLVSVILEGKFLPRLIFIAALTSFYRCLNQMRDFGCRLVALMVGYGGETFTVRNGWWFWGGWVTTISACLKFFVLYDTFIFILVANLPSTTSLDGA